MALQLPVINSRTKYNNMNYARKSTKYFFQLSDNRPQNFIFEMNSIGKIDESVVNDGPVKVNNSLVKSNYCKKLQYLTTKC